MALKILLNIFYNIAIFLLVLTIVWSFNNQRYELLAAAVFSIVLIIILKIRLIQLIKLIKHLTKGR